MRSRFLRLEIVHPFDFTLVFFGEAALGRSSSAPAVLTSEQDLKVLEKLEKLQAPSWSSVSASFLDAKSWQEMRNLWLRAEEEAKGSKKTGGAERSSQTL